ncbi:MAG: hypothetical protein LWX11_02120 [Firmicutes bacterium]|nr:hypothetical protein [Bacillota bacterium]
MFLPLSAQAPALLPGEGLAMVGADGVIQAYGEADRESPMGSLAKLVWIRFQGDEWAARDMGFRCVKGGVNGYECWEKKGHGRVDLAKALKESCNLAFLAWADWSLAEEKRLYGDGVTRVRLEDAFRPFLGTRLKPGNEVPALGPPWIGDGDLLRTTPRAMLQWMIHPAQERMMAQCRRLMLGFQGFVMEKPTWWMKTGTAPVPGEYGETCAWVAGSNGVVTAVLRVPRGKGRSDGLARFKAIMGLP